MFESSNRPRRNYRGRKDDSDDEKNGDTENAMAKLPTQTARPQPPKMSTLSFGDDLEMNATDDAVDDSEIPTVKPLNKASSEQFSSMLKHGVIPDANTIHLARKQRQRAKFQLEAATAEDEVTPSAQLIPVSKNDGRRLIREDDDDEDIDEDTGDVAPILSQQRPAFQVGEFHDPKMRRVDISRGLHRKEDERRSIREDFLAAEHASDLVLDALQPVPGINEQKTGQTKRSSDAYHSPSGDISLSSIKSILQTRREKLKQAVDSNKAELAAAQEDLARGQDLICKSRTTLPEHANSLVFFQEIRDYVRDVIDCFSEKMSKIEYLDRKSIMLYRERADNLSSRRRSDVKDIADEVAIGLAGACVKEDAKAAEARQRRKADREARRARRLRQLEVANIAAAHDTSSQGTGPVRRFEVLLGIPSPYDGVSTDDEESPAVIAKRKADTNDILNDAQRLFDDTVEEYCTLSSILGHFEEWRRRSPSTYAKAYIALCLPQLLSPLIRLQLLGWNPIKPNCACYDEQSWFSDLVDYSAGLSKCHKNGPSFKVGDCSEDDEEEVSRTLSTSPDQDLSIIPSTVEKILVPRLTEIVSSSWDPLSTNQSQRLVKTVRSLVTQWPTVNTDSLSTKQLFEAILKRMEVTIQEDVFIPLYPKHILTNPQSPGYLFFCRQMNAAMKMLSNLMLWHDLFASAALQHVVLTCLVNRYILVGLASLVSVCGLSAPSPSEPDTAAVVTHFEPLPSGEVALLRQVVGRLKALLTHLKPVALTWLNPEADQETTESASRLAQLRRFVSQLAGRLSVYGRGTGTATSTAQTPAEIELE
ncbi:unnamed protein product [Schistocephalus solidus]|uniref:GCFC domain-containing protein n=1 Tax=Schistocephalus solidus TaxID=70667 RepID=A0A183SKP7_SCHSO|nr:unnamed protein product [Schistocephalus solidus]